MDHKLKNKTYKDTWVDLLRVWDRCSHIFVLLVEWLYHFKIQRSRCKSQDTLLQKRKEKNEGSKVLGWKSERCKITLKSLNIFKSIVSIIIFKIHDINPKFPSQFLYVLKSHKFKFISNFSRQFLEGSMEEEEHEEDHGLANTILSCPNRIPGDSLSFHASVSTHLLFHQLLIIFFLGFAGACIRSILITSCFSQYSFVGFASLEYLLSLLYLFHPFDQKMKLLLEAFYFLSF